MAVSIYISDFVIIQRNNQYFQEVEVKVDGGKIGLLLRPMNLGDDGNAYRMEGWYPNKELWLELAGRGYTKDFNGRHNRIEPFTSTYFVSLTLAKDAIEKFLNRVYHPEHEWSDEDE